MDQLFSSQPVPGLKGDNYRGHVYVAKSVGKIRLLCILNSHFSHCRRFLGVSQHPQVAGHYGSNSAEVPNTRLVKVRHVKWGGACYPRMLGNLVIQAGEVTHNRKVAMGDSLGQGVSSLFGCGFHSTCEFSEAAKIAASNLPPMQRSEEIQLHRCIVNVFRNF